jgi:hypothetical protein
MTQLHSALFIDYDNVSIELERYDPAIAARFSNKTLLWLDALEKHLPLPDGSEAEARRIVARRCYASPQQINAHRRNFTQTGFEVIDCPPLTTHLKNSADIYIVMDIIDYLQRYPHIDEYIILSADADFVPVLNRLRKELKKSSSSPRTTPPPPTGIAPIGPSRQTSSPSIWPSSGSLRGPRKRKRRLRQPLPRPPTRPAARPPRPARRTRDWPPPWSNA